tara:strand:- start:1382 stop:1801 length:420 start_codon:yes stop_codon:yes gene_type:complete
MNQKPFKILGIEHVGIAMQNMEGISTFFSDILGLEYLGSEKIDDQQVVTDIFNTGGGKLEFLQTTDPNSPISKFIDKKGAGMHHIALLVDNVQVALDYLQKEGVELIDTTPRIGAEGFHIAFLHPRSTAGILVELCQKA